MFFVRLLRFWVTGQPLAKKVDLLDDFTAFRSGSVVDIAVPNDALLVRDVTLPAMSGQALTRAVELDAVRATPFRKETISIGQTILSKTGKNVLVRQFVARHSDIDQWIEKARNAGLLVRAVVPAEAPTSRLVDFTDTLMQKTAIWRKLNVLLLLVILALAAVSIWRPVVAIQKEQALAETTVSDLRAEVGRLQTQIDGIGNRSIGLRMISDRRARSAEILGQIDLLTNVLPDTAWVTDIAFDADIMRVTGIVNGDPLNLLEQIAGAPGFGAPVLTTSFALSDGTGAQRFEIEVPREEGQP